MLDKRSIKILNIINGECKERDYAVIEKDFIISALKNNLKTNKDALKEYINNLYLKGFINLKYEDDVEICVSLTIKGRALLENDFDKSEFNKKTLNKVFVFSFLGAIFANTVFYLVLILIKILFGEK